MGFEQRGAVGARWLTRIVAAACVVTGFGCDPTSGISDTADGILPDRKRYIEAPGDHLTDGPYYRVAIDADLDTFFHLGARRRDDEEPTFHIFGPDAREGCAVSPNVGTWLWSKPPGAPDRLLPYQESSDDEGRGTLRFTSVDCEVAALKIEDASAPESVSLTSGYLVEQRGKYLVADPWKNETRVVVENPKRWLWSRGPHLIWVDEKLKSFDEELEPVSEFGNGVKTAIAVPPSTFLIEDEEGIFATWLGEAGEIEHAKTLEGACRLQQGDTQIQFVVAESPCGSGEVVAYQLGQLGEVIEEHPIPVDAEVDTRRAKVEPRYVDGELDALMLFYLTDVDEDGYGTAWAAREGEEPLRLGEKSRLSYLGLSFAWKGFEGSALVDRERRGRYDVTRWVRFNVSDGKVEKVADGRTANAPVDQFLVDFDGTAGTLMDLADGELRLNTPGAPPFRTLRYSDDAAFASRIQEFDGTLGTLAVSRTPSEANTFESFAERVLPDSVRFALFMPGLFFLEDVDPETRAGTLVVYNYELEARGTIARGVTSYELTSYPIDGVIYTVPSGKNEGIWFARAK